jgi:hypothetical protein
MTRGHVAERLGAIAAVLMAWIVCAGAALAASPSPEPVGGDPRSSGQGPGLVGDPLFALLAVIVIGIGSMLATLAYVKVTARRGG